MKEEKLFNKIRDFLSYEKYYYDKKRGAFILEDRPKENTYIFSCTCDDVGFYVVYMEKGENKTHIFLKNTKEYERLSMYFDMLKQTWWDKLIPHSYTIMGVDLNIHHLQQTKKINEMEKLKGEILNKQVNKQQQEEKELIIENTKKFLNEYRRILIPKKLNEDYERLGIEEDTRILKKYDILDICFNNNSKQLEIQYHIENNNNKILFLNMYDDMQLFYLYANIFISRVCDIRFHNYNIKMANKEKKEQKIKDINKQQQGAEMTKEEENALIIKNAFEFLKRDDLVLKDEYNIICKNNDENISKILGIRAYNSCNYFYAIAIYDKKTGCLPFITMKDNEELFKLYQTKLNELLKANNRELIKELTLEEWEERHSLIDYAERQNEKRAEKYNNKSVEERIKENGKLGNCGYCVCTQPQDDYYSRKHDKGKPKLLQVPVQSITAISEIMDYGSQKYGANSWQCVEAERYLQAGARHLYAIQEKDEQGRITFNLAKKDEESGKEHIKHALCNLAYAVALYEMKKEK